MKFDNINLQNHLRRTFLSFCSDEQLQDLVKLGQVIEVESQQRIPREEQPVSFYLVLEGEVLLRQRGTYMEMDRREEGRSLEVRALLLHLQQWQYDWQSESKCALLKVPWSAIETILQKYPTQLQYLARITQSVALQRLKRDLLSLNLSRTSTIELISKMRQEKVSDLKPNENNDKLLVTVFSGEIVVQMQDGQKPFHLMTLVAGDTTIIDWTQTHLCYVPQDGAAVWVITESEWKSLLDQKDFSEFLSLFNRKVQSPRPQPIDDEPTVSMILPIKKPVLAAAPSLQPVAQNLKTLNAFGYLLWKLKRPAVIASVDDDRTSTSVLSFILKQAGYFVRHKEIDLRVPEEWDDKSLANFIKKAAKVGVQGEIKEINQLLFGQTVVVQLKTGFAILYRKHKEFWTLADFNSGSYRDIPVKSLVNEIKEEKCFVVQHVKNVFSGDRKEFRFEHLFKFLLVDKTILGFLLMGSILGFIVELSVPVFSQYMIDQVVVSGHVALLNPLMLAFAALTIVGVLISWFNQSHNNYLSNVLSARLKAFFQSAIFKLNPLVAQNMGASQLMNRISDIEPLSTFLVQQCFGSVLSLVFMLGNLSVLWIYQPSLVFLVLSLLPFGVGLTFLMKSRIENLKLQQVRAKSRENRMYLEHFSSSDDMRTLKGTLPARWKWDFNSQIMAKNLISSQKLMALFQVLQMIGSEGVKMIAFFFSLRLYMSSQLTLGQLMALVMILPRVTDPIQALVSTVYQYFNNKILLTRLNDLLIEVPQNKNKLASDVMFNKSIQFDNVSLGFEKGSSRRNIKNLNFQIAAGEKVIFMGTSGSGKTSLSYLLAGLFEADEGQILFDGLPKTKIDPAHFHSNVSIVEQDGRLFVGSILDNIALGDERPNLEFAVKCAKAVVLDDDILARPGGYGSSLLHGGAGLSEGQRQRLLIARALYRSPQVLILDEATSYLDPISERQVMRNIVHCMQSKTLIILTQRIQMTTRVDRIFFLDDGQLIEHGSHRDLISKRENYFKFYLKHLSIG